MTEQLKPLPCPFCGGAAHFFKITDLDEKNFGGEGICCGSCPITTDLMFSLMEDCKPKLAEAWNRRAQPAQAVPVLTDAEIDTAYEKARADYQRSRFAVRGQQLTAQDSPDWWFARAIEQAVRAKLGVAVPMPEQISEGEFAPDAKLLELADKIDHEQNWRHSGIFQRDHLTQDQKDRVLAGVMLRRYADLMAPESWRLFPPKSVVSHSYRAASLDAVVKMAERHGIVGKEGA